MLALGAAWGCLETLSPFITLITLFFLPLSGKQLDIDSNTASLAVTSNQQTYLQQHIVECSAKSCNPAMMGLEPLR